MPFTPSRRAQPTRPTTPQGVRVLWPRRRGRPARHSVDSRGSPSACLALFALRPFRAGVGGAFVIIYHLLPRRPLSRLATVARLWIDRLLPILSCLALLRGQEFATAVSPSTLLRPLGPFASKTVQSGLGAARTRTPLRTAQSVGARSKPECTLITLITTGFRRFSDFPPLA